MGKTVSIILRHVLLLDMSMSGLEGGAPRVYRNVAPTITARLHKDPYMVLWRTIYEHRDS